MKQLTAKPVIKNVDLEELKASFDKPAKKAAPAKAAKAAKEEKPVEEKKESGAEE